MCGRRYRRRDRSSGARGLISEFRAYVASANPSPRIPRRFLEVCLLQGVDGRPAAQDNCRRPGVEAVARSQSFEEATGDWRPPVIRRYADDKGPIALEAWHEGREY